ncbi:hypothetical protein AALP_AA5G022600 [Arabis alpina]|uniref:Uncharacterized protein n=1 Tax=Arabis alpina TaxID=50452 RepID=A0A087GUG0_ARAAL|nr:hypothetical protein AALP_AA5G022600 [Arabis alpina]
MKSLFKNKTRTPTEIVRQTRDLLALSEADDTELDSSKSKRLGICAELCRNIRDLKSILYGNSEAEPLEKTLHRS